MILFKENKSPNLYLSGLYEVVLISVDLGAGNISLDLVTIEHQKNLFPVAYQHLMLCLLPRSIMPTGMDRTSFHCSLGDHIPVPSLPVICCVDFGPEQDSLYTVHMTSGTQGFKSANTQTLSTT